MCKDSYVMLHELYRLDVNGDYEITFLGGKRWKLKNKLTGEGLYTDKGFSVAKKWLMNDLNKRKE